MGAILIAIFLSLLAAELTEIAPWLAARLVDAAVGRLPEELRERYREEWHGELEACPGKMLKLAAAVWIVAVAEATGEELVGTPRRVRDSVVRAWGAAAAFAASARDGAVRARRGVARWRAEAPADALGRVVFLAWTVAAAARLTARLAAALVSGLLRARVRRRLAVGSDTERVARIARDSGQPVDDVLREVADFRLALETDMLVAAAAVDADEAGIADDVLAAERAELSSFQDRLLERLADASRPARRRRG